MVQLSLSSVGGNQGARYFPLKGFLGLTPVEVEGVVRTKLDSDAKPLAASSITVSVRCYECRQGRVNTLDSRMIVDETQVLWSKPRDAQYADVAELELPFRFTLPTEIGGYSMASFVEYRVLWKIEAYIHHIHIPGVGSRQTKYAYLPLIRYDVPSNRIPPVPTNILQRQTSRTRIPPIQYTMRTPAQAIGPSDLVSISLSLTLPTTPSVSLRGAIVLIERRLQLKEFSVTSLPPTTSPLQDSVMRSTNRSASTLTSESPLLSPDTRGANPPNDSRMSITAVANVESSGNFTKDAQGSWNKTLTLQWPVVKSNGRWAIGETIQSDMVSITFVARVKILVSSTLGNETIDLAEQELLVVSTNETERRMAWSKYSERLDATGKSPRSKSKSPRRKHDRQTSAPLDQNSEVGPSRQRSNKVPRTGASSRRPHTSAGPRDQSCNFRNELQYDCPPPLSTAAAESIRPDSAPPSRTTSAAKSSVTTVTELTLSQAVDQVQLLAWEQELARIEAESRRLSSSWFTLSKRKRHGLGPGEPTPCIS